MSKAALLFVLFLPTASADGPDMVIVPKPALQSMAARNQALVDALEKAADEIERLSGIIRNGMGCS